MTVALYRVDNRLVHGQVLEGWRPRLNADAILVVDERRAADSFQRSLLEGMGQGVTEVRALTPAAAARELEEKYKRRSVIVLFHGLPEAREAFEAGVRFDTLNLGNLHPREDSRRLNGNVNLTPEDEALLLDLSAQGVRIEARAVPTDDSPDVLKFCRAGRDG